jgi:hypothetical protein
MSNDPSRIEFITGRERRQRYTAEHKLRLVEETMQPGMAVSAVARLHGVSPSLLFKWRQLMSESGRTAVSVTPLLGRVCFTFGAGWSWWHRGRGNGGPDMMKTLGSWSPAPYLNVTAVERGESRWFVAPSRSRHSFYMRTLGDLSAQGTPVTIRVRVSRWRCRNERCERQIFAESLPGLAAPSARQTDRLAAIVRLFGHSTGGRPSARLMARLGMRTSHTPGPSPNEPRSASLVSMSGLGGRV